MNQRESQRYARTMCEHVNSKRLCGRILNKFTCTYTEEVAAIFVHDIITLDFFHDLSGTLKDFLFELTRIQQAVDTLISQSHRRDSEGEMLESDEDSQGNLR